MSGSRRALGAVGATLAAILLIACGEEKRMPALSGERLDVAGDRLEQAGISYTEVTTDEVTEAERSIYEVCNTEPPKDAEVKAKVLLIVRKQGTCE